MPVPPSCISSKILKQARERTVGSALESGKHNDIWTCLSRLQGRPSLFPNRTGPSFLTPDFPDGHRTPDHFPCPSSREAFPRRALHCACVAASNDTRKCLMPVASRLGWVVEKKGLLCFLRSQVSEFEVNSTEVLVWKDLRKFYSRQIKTKNQLPKPGIEPGTFRSSV